MKIAGGLLLLAMSAFAAAAQTDELPQVHYPTLPTFARQPADFVPNGWKAVAIKSGDLNGDGRSDTAILMRMADPTNIKPVESNPYYKQDDTNPYLLAIAFAHPNGYKLATSNHGLFPRELAPMHGETPPSADTVEIARGVLTLAFEHLRSTDQFRFRWNGKAFSLIGYDCGGVAGGTIYGLSANYLTRKARIERGEVGNDKSDFWTVRIRSGKRPTLEHIERGFDVGTDEDGDFLSC